MKNKFNLMFVAMLLMALPLLVSSCDDDDDKIDEVNPVNPDNPDTPTPTEKEKAEYTIIYYGHGGGDLDGGIISNIVDLCAAEDASYKKVSVAVQYKFSSQMGLIENFGDIKDDPEEGIDSELYGSSTIRFVVDPSKDIEKLLEDDVKTIMLKDKNLHIADPKNLTEFINWAADSCPANKYIIVLSDHGGGYAPHEELPSSSLSKGLVYDDSNFIYIKGTEDVQREHFTVHTLVQAITDSKVRPEVIYLDACLMNTIEYQFELKDLANYLVLSGLSVPGPGGDYVTLVNELAKDQDIEAALTNFCKATVKTWDEATDEETNERMFVYSDITAIRTANIAAFGNEWKEFTSRLISAYQSGDANAKEAIDDATLNAFSMTVGFPMYDMIDYANSIFEAAPDFFDEQFTKGFNDAYDATIVHHQPCKEFAKYGFTIGASVMLGCQNHFTNYNWDAEFDDDFEETGNIAYYGCAQYASDGTMKIYDAEDNLEKTKSWGSTFNDTYKTLKFDQLTGWSSWIEINEQEASRYSPAEFEWELTEDGFVNPYEEEELPIAAKK